MIDISKIKPIPAVKSRGRTKYAVVQFLIGGEPIAGFESAQEAAEKLFPNLENWKYKGKVQSICRAAKGSIVKGKAQQTAFGFQWRYLKDVKMKK